MSEHTVALEWRRTTPDFRYQSYGRDHTWRLGTGSTVEVSAAREYLGNPSRMNPEEALVGALSSCHMLTFLAVAARKGFVVDSYRDDAVGTLEKNELGRMAVTRVVLRPVVTFGGETAPTGDELAALHHSAHAGCFIANSVKTEVRVEPG